MIVNRDGPDAKESFKPFNITIYFETEQEAYMLWSRLNPNFGDFREAFKDRCHKRLRKDGITGTYKIFNAVEDGLEDQGLGMDN